MGYPTEQFLHDEINLKRLVRRLEKSASKEFKTASSDDHVWIRAQGRLQIIKHARKLLKNVHLCDENPTPLKIQQLDSFRIALDNVEAFAKEVEHRTTPKPVRPELILPRIPLPSVEPHSQKETRTSLSAEDLLQVPSDTTPYPSPTTLIPSTMPHSSAIKAPATSTTIRHLQNSSALQHELTDQLAQMAAQLRRNAVHLSDSLAKDHDVVEDAQQKLEGNYDTMHEERNRLRNLSGKSKSTTCLLFLVVTAVLSLFILIVSIIRFT